MKVVFIALVALLFVSCGEMKTQSGSLEGNWKEIAASAKNQSFWKINHDGTGFMCFKNGTASTPTKIHDGKMNSVFATNETLQMDGKILARRGVKNGKEYAHYYVRISTVPEWCKQLEKMYWE